MSIESKRSQITDYHTLFVKCDCATADQIRRAFIHAMETYQREYETTIDPRFYVNLVMDSNGKSFGIAFVFVIDSRVYHMLLGKNPDGSDRIEYIDDVSTIPLKDGELVNEYGWSSIAPAIDTETTSWADSCLMEEERNKNTRSRSYISLSPLMILPPFKLSPEQQEEKRLKYIEDNQGKPGFDPSLVKVDEWEHFTVNRALAYPVDSKYMPNILKTKDVPSWITRDHLKAEFMPYASDSVTLHERFIKGNKIEEAYPFVNINNDRVAFIIFDPSTHDAQFALHMMKKKTITKRFPDGTINTVTLLFGHSFRTDRDMMADISQQPRLIQRHHYTLREPISKPERNSSFPQKEKSKRKNVLSRDYMQKITRSVKPQSRFSDKIQTDNRFNLLSDSE